MWRKLAPVIFLIFANDYFRLRCPKRIGCIDFAECGAWCSARVIGAGELGSSVHGSELFGGKFCIDAAGWHPWRVATHVGGICCGILVGIVGNESGHHAGLSHGKDSGIGIY